MFLFFFVCLCTAVDAASSFYSLKSNFMTSIQSPSEWGISRLAVGYAGLYRNFCNAFFSMERKKSVKCSLRWQAFWVALQPILYSVPSKEGLTKKIKLVLQACHSISSCKYPPLQVFTPTCEACQERGISKILLCWWQYPRDVPIITIWANVIIIMIWVGLSLPLC